jgi:ABC-type multidrug transport system fused ATPase/permease subunit
MNHFLDLAAMLLIPLLVVLIPVFIGQRYGIYISKKSTDIKEAPVGTVVGTAFGLLAFMLAFTFQIATNRYDARKELLLDEVTNIRTTYLRAGLLQEPFCTNTKELLVEYVDLRVALSEDTAMLKTALFRSQQILDTLWRYTERLAEQDRSSEVYALYTTSVNDLVANFNQRVSMTLEYRIPPLVLWILLIIAFFAMLTLGYQFGISGKGNFGVNLILALIFAVVMLLILALDRPETGMAKINQKPMLTLQRQLQAAQLNKP